MAEGQSKLAVDTGPRALRAAAAYATAAVLDDPKYGSRAADLARRLMKATTGGADD